MLLERNGDLIRLHWQENKPVAVFNIRYWVDVQRLQNLTKMWFDLALNHERCIVDCNKMEVEIL